MQTVNDYDKDVFNGDIGRVARIDEVEQELVVQVDEREVIGEKRPKGGQERRVVGGEKAPKREPPQRPIMGVWRRFQMPEVRKDVGGGAL